MKLNLKFKENKQILDLKFGQIQEVSDGGFDRGYEEGFDKGYNEGEINGRNEGYADGYLQGEQKGFENCLQRLEPIEISENGEYLPEGESVGFSSVNVNLPIPENKLASLVDGSITEVTARDLEGATSIGDYAFYNCSKLTSIDFGNNSKLKTIGAQAFRGCTILTNIEIPYGLTTIGTYAFRECRNITSIHIPNTVTSIGSAFYQCYGLTNISIPSSVTELAAEAFGSCSKLVNIDIPNSISKIGNTAFSGCSSLISITIPSSVTSIGSTALSIGSPSKKATITFLGTTPPTIATNTFTSSRLNKIIVPKGCGDTYKSATNWSNFADYIEEAVE
jgi:hypothetical protein